MMQLCITYREGKTEFYTVEKVESPRMNHNGFFYIDMYENDSKSVLIVRADIVERMIVTDNIHAEVNKEDGILQS